MTDLLCTTDLTPASDTAVRHAQALCDRLGSRLTVLHALGRHQRDDAEKESVRSAIERQLTEAGNAGARVLLPEGDFMNEIIEESKRGHQFVVMGTHGPKGLRQSLFGADILKLVRKSAVPCYVVQSGSPLDRELSRIVLPVAGHKDIDRLLEAVCLMAKAWAAEVHIFQLMRPGESPSDELLDNKLRMQERLEQEGVRHVEANEPSSGFSVGFAQATIDYSKRIGAGAIAIMAHASEEYRYIADAEKERILANEPGIPVLCA
ncbi:MAG: universal stress protein [Flavobacteriales bacterium]|nr:universal stress protein [Flavobacteriales bacterium]